MKANFALSLSFDGIKLLHRAAGGWRRVGDIALDVPDLPAAMAELRVKAESLEPNGLASKLIIPDGQIKYLTLDTGDLDEPARREAAEAALDGATPYAVADLAFDFTPDGAQTHVAAVARETLAEAEDFAVQFGFNPLFTAAIPGDAPFLGEPCFGPTAYSAQLLGPDDQIEPDGIAVVEIGDIAPADNAAEPQETPGEPAEPEPSAPLSEQAPVDGPRITLQPTPADTAPDQDDDAPVPAAPPVVQVAGFSSRRARGSAASRDPDMPALGGVMRSEDTPPAPGGAQIIAASIPDLDDAPSASAGSAPAARHANDPSADLTTPDAAAASLRKPVPEPAADDAPPRRAGGFLSRRRQAPPPAPNAPPSPDLDEKAAVRAARASERQRLTVFGARKDAGGKEAVVGGKPRYLGVVLTAALLVFLAAVAAWAALFTEDGVAGWFGAPSEDSPIEAAELEAEPEPDQEAPVTASLDPGAFLQTAPPPRILQAEPAPPPAFDLTAAQEFYAVSGIWTVPSLVPPAPRYVPLDDLYHSSLDPSIPSLDAVALPRLPDYVEQDVLPEQVSPAPQGTTFDYDERGLIVATPEGALSPDGFTVFAGRPPAVPPLRPAPPEQDETSLAPVIDTALAAARPRARPDALIENAERRNLGGLSRSELAQLRPRARPDTEKAADEADETPTQNATAQSLRPNTRPQNFATLVARAQEQRRANPAPQNTVQSAAAPPASVSPSIPSRASVTRQATIENALNLRRINLMGVYGKPSDRSALVRLANGRYRKVQVGDRLDGGRVSAIGESEVRYQKNGRNLSLKMPRS